MLIVASSMLTACPPKVPTPAQRIDHRLASLEPTAKVFKSDALLSGYGAGQWLQYKAIDENAEPTILTFKLIASDGFNHSLELVEEGYHGAVAIYMEIQYDPGRSLDSLQVRRVLTRHGETTPKESSPEDLLVKESFYRSLASQWFVPWADEAVAGDTTVIAGQFLGCHQGETSLNISGLAFRATTWHHPALPMNAMVKAERSDGTEGTVELIDFGLDGAHSDVLRAVR